MPRPFWKGYGTMDEFITALLLRMKELSVNPTFNNITAEGNITASSYFNGLYYRTTYTQTLGAGATTFAATQRQFLKLTGDGGGNTFATITGGSQE